MTKTALGVLGGAVIVLLAVSFGQVSAQTPPAAAPACRTLSDKAACQGRVDCRWAEASDKRKAGCRRKKPK